MAAHTVLNMEAFDWMVVQEAMVMFAQEMDDLGLLEPTWTQYFSDFFFSCGMFEMFKWNGIFEWKEMVGIFERWMPHLS